MKNISAAKEERVELRVSGDFKTLFAKAAEISGVSINTFILESVRERAMHIIDQHERIVLSNQARDMLLNAISTRSSPGKALRRAAGRFAIR
ncbi:MAG TPA: DUF1778 domain-containing protein [Gammaproteobacteria bacterium]|nr:DUF1778 domain-containing protein [Gammaproteobacteria bacterium]